MSEFTAPASVFTGVPGWESPDEQQLLVQYAGNVPEEGIIVEIGAEYGMSASLFCAFAKQSVKIFSVDLFPGELLRTHRHNLASQGYGQRSIQVKGDSHEIGKRWTEIPIDLLFIDGDHSYQGVVLDIKAWLPLVTVGGFVLFHDCECVTNLNPVPVIHAEVSQAIDDTLDRSMWLELPSVDSIRLFVRARL